MLGDNDIETLIDEPVTAADLFGEDDQENAPPLSPNPDLDENAASATTGDGGTEDGAAQAKKRRQINRLPNLNEKWITDPKKEGMYAVNKYFENINLKRGKGNELNNITAILKRYEYWAQQCYPKLCFKDFVDKVENLSTKKLVKNSLQEIRCNRSDGDKNNGDNNVDDGDNDTVPPDDADPFLNTSAPITSPSTSQAFTSFTSQQPITDSNNTVNEDMREIIRKKREEAISKRKRKLEESMNRSNISVTQGNDTSILDSSVISTADDSNQPLNSTHDSISQSEMEVSEGEGLKEIIRKKREEAFLKSQQALEESQTKPAPAIDRTTSQEQMSVSEPSADIIEPRSSMSVSEVEEQKSNAEEMSEDSAMSCSDVEKVLEINDVTLRGSSIEEPSDVELPSDVALPQLNGSLNTSNNPADDMKSKDMCDLEATSSSEKEKMDVDG